MLTVTPAALHSQSVTSGSVTGTVTDPSGAVITGARVALSLHGTGTVLSTLTNDSGVYFFPNVPPGDYTLRCTVKGFETTEIAAIHVEVTKSYTYDITQKLGASSTVVEVRSVPGGELQTSNASIGTVISGETLLRLPAQQRSITALILLQAGAAPQPPGPEGSGDASGGMINGAASDETTFYVDGGDATSDLEGTNLYVSPPGEPQPAPFIAVPAEWTQEFRVVTAGSPASFARSQGGEVAVLTKSGSNSFHGAGYEYYFGSGTSANEWELNLLGIARPHAVNNRFGVDGGGYILKDKLYFYGGYEGRQFFQNTTITQLVPTSTARAGILTFGGVQYNLNPANGALATNCGPAANLPCDPRGIGVSPLVLQYMTLLPMSNDPTQGDGVNSSGYTASFATPIKENLGVVRLDYNISKRWSIFATYHINKYELATRDQVDIACATPNCTTGANRLLSTTPVQPRLVTFLLTGTVGANFTSQTHGSYMRDWWAFKRAPYVPQLSGTAGVINLSGEGGDEGVGPGSKVWPDPITVNSNNAHTRHWAGKDYFVAQDASWLHGKHMLQFGGGYYFWHLDHLRTDAGDALSLGPAYYVGETDRNGGSFLQIPGSQQPATCSDFITSACKRWDNMFSSLLGLLDRSAQLGTRNGDFIANPLGTPLEDLVHAHTFNVYFQDVWKLRPSLTFTYGVSYGVQFAPTEVNGKQVVEVFANSNQPVENASAYFADRNAALGSGNFYASGLTAATDATFGFVPIRHLPGRSSSAPTQWNGFGPRVALAWNVPRTNWVFGREQAVVRVGYSILWNRTNAVGEAMIPLLGNGLASADLCAGPTFNGTTSASCSNSTIDASNGFRLGTDGSTVPIPPFSNAPIPLVGSSPFGVPVTVVQDPRIRLPYSHNITLDIQRAFSNNMLLDVGAIGRFSRNQWMNQDLNAADIFAKTPACTANGATCQITTSGQTLAQAYNALNGAPTVPQAFFENAPFGCAGCSALAAQDAGDPSLASFMLFNYDLVAPRPLDPLQSVINNMVTSDAKSNYGAMFVTFRKAFAQGLELAANYTWSHAVGTSGGNFLNQEYSETASPTPFDLNSGTGSNNGDRRHVMNVYGFYQMPFGKGREYPLGNAFLDRAIGGWYVSGIWTWQTGLPDCVYADGDYGSIDGFTCAVGATFFGKLGRHDGVAGSAGVGTNGDPATGGSGINLFADPKAVFNALRVPLPGVDSRPDVETFNLPRSWNVDLSFGKAILVTERSKIVFSADFFNVFNHPIFGTAYSESLDLADPAGFGVVHQASNAARVIQFGLRFEF